MAKKLARGVQKEIEGFEEAIQEAQAVHDAKLEAYDALDERLREVRAKLAGLPEWRRVSDPQESAKLRERQNWLEDKRKDLKHRTRQARSEKRHAWQRVMARRQDLGKYTRS